MWFWRHFGGKDSFIAACCEGKRTMVTCSCQCYLKVFFFFFFEVVWILNTWPQVPFELELNLNGSRCWNHLSQYTCVCVHGARAQTGFPLLNLIEKLEAANLSHVYYCCPMLITLFLPELSWFHLNTNHPNYDSLIHRLISIISFTKKLGNESNFLIILLLVKYDILIHWLIS